MDTPAERTRAAAPAVPGTLSPGTSRPVTVGVFVFLAAAFLVTWWRLFRGADLVDEAFSVLVPWRWALGDRPFVDEQNLSQSFGLVAYPFVKLYAVLSGNDATGLVLYDRHLYLSLCVLTAASVFLLARRSLGVTLASLVALPFVTVILFGTPQVTANTVCALLLSSGAALGAVAVLGGGRMWALPSGIAVGLAGIAYPTVLLLTPFVAVFLAFSVGDRFVSVLAREWASSTALEASASGVRAWRMLSGWAAGGALVVLPIVATVVAIAGLANLQRCWDYTIALARRLDQLGGTSKAGEIAVSFASLVGHQWYLPAAAVCSLLVFRWRPVAGRWLLMLAPLAVWVAGSRSGLGVAGSVIVYGLAAPFLYLFLPGDRKGDGARLLLCVWAPATLVGAMTAYTSADGFVRAAVGLLSAVVVSGLFLAWGLQPLGGGRRSSWATAVGLAAVVVATLAFQFGSAGAGAARSELTARMDSGPWMGIALTTTQRGLLEGYAAELAKTAEPDDELLIYPQGSAYYLYWDGGVASNTYQLYADDPAAPLPEATVSYFRRHRVVPTLVVHVMRTPGKSRLQLENESGGLEYPAVRVSPTRVFNRKPPGETVEDVLSRLPRQ